MEQEKTDDEIKLGLEDNGKRLTVFYIASHVCSIMLGLVVGISMMIDYNRQTIFFSVGIIAMILVLAVLLFLSMKIFKNTLISCVGKREEEFRELGPDGNLK